MSPRPSSPTSLPATDPSLRSNDEDEQARSVTRTDSLAAEEEMLPATVEEPVETAYSHQTKVGISPVVRPKKRFGTALKDDAKASIGGGATTRNIECSQSSLMAAITNDDDDDDDDADVEQRREKRSWELDEFGEEEEDDAENGDEPMLDSQDTADSSSQNMEVPSEGKENEDSAEETQSTRTESGTKGDTDMVNSDDQSKATGGSAKKDSRADESEDEQEVESEEKESSPVEQITKDDIADKNMEASEKTAKHNNDVKEDEDSDKEEEKSKPSIDDLKLSVEYFFCEADKQTVTVKNIFSAVEAEHSISLEKGDKKILRAHLVALMQGDIKPSVGNYVEDEEVGDEESESSSDESSDEEEQPSSEYEDEEETHARGRRPTKKKQKSTLSKTKKDSAPSRRKSTRKPKKAKKGSIHEHAEKLRQKRMQELRVRNEELQLAQSKEDQKRAEMIAAKFETNSDELRLERLEARLDLLQQLDQKRLKIMTAEGQYEGEIKEEPKVEEEEDDDTDSDDDDMELEIVGPKNSNKPLFPSITAKPDPRKSNPLASVLDLADKVSPMKKDPSKKNSLAKAKKQRQLSPSRSKDARAMLRNALKSKQRKMGNMWLARELGYKNEKDHLRDCWETEKKKREQVLRMEAERLVTNERAQLRERLRDPEPLDENDLEEGENQDSEYQEEEDEELQLARQMEEEKEASEAQEMADAAETEVPQRASVGTKAEDAHAEETEATATEDHTEPNSGDFSDNECTQESIFPDAQDDMPMNLDLDLEDTAVISNDTQTPEATTQEGGPSSEPSDESQEESQLETQQFETQAPLVISRAGEVSKTTNGEEPVDDKKKTTSAEDEADIVDTDDEEEFVGDEDDGTEKPKEESKKDRNAAWKAMLQREADKLKKSKKRKGGNEYLEAEAEEEEEEAVAGLEDFGFSVHKKKENDDEDDNDDEFNEDDLKDVVDDVSDDEGDEETGDKMRRAMAEKEEKERHKEMLRRMREGYDGRRGGIAGSGAGARGVHRFDQLVAADNKETAKRLGLLNDDELDSDDEGNGANKDDNEEEDEAALIDKMLKDRFLHRSSVEFEENFSEDDEDDEEGENNENGKSENDDDDQEQEKLAKRFAKRARMQRLMEEYGSNEEFTDSRLIEEDTNMKEELSRMKNGLARKRSIASVSRTSSISTGSASNSGDANAKRQKNSGSFFTGVMANSGSLSLALQSSRQQSQSKRTSFLGAHSQSSTFCDNGCNSQKSISFNHVVFQSDSQMSFRGTGKSQSNPQKSLGSLPGSKLGARRPVASSRSSSLWSKVMTTGPQKRL